MSANKKPRKKYKPKGVIRDPVNFVVAGSRPASEEIQLDTKILYHSAMTQMVQGNGKKDDWQTLANAMNVGLILCEMGYGQEFVPDLVKAQGAMVLVKQRFRATGKMGLRGEEMQAINVALDLHDQQLALTPIRDIERAVLCVDRELRRGNFVTVEPSAQQQPSLQQTLAV